MRVANKPRTGLRVLSALSHIGTTIYPRWRQVGGMTVPRWRLSWAGVLSDNPIINHQRYFLTAGFRRMQHTPQVCWSDQLQWTCLRAVGRVQLASSASSIVSAVSSYPGTSSLTSCRLRSDLKCSNLCRERLFVKPSAGISLVGR